MAYTIENNYTGNNSTVLYSFTFPYLETTDIKVSLDAVDTSAYTLASATQVQFNTAPGTGVKIRIYRDTDIDNLRAEFFSGSAIRAQDLNEDFLQTLYSGQESEDAVAKKMSTTGTSTMTGNLLMGEDTSIIFEGATDDAYETTLTVTDPTADRTITLPNVTGTVVTTGDTGTVTATMMAADSVDSSELVDGSIDTSHIANSAVTSAKIADGTIVTADLATSAVATANIADGAITTTKYSAASINTAAIGDGEVTAAKLATSSVTTDKLAGTSVTGAKIANDAIDSNHYAADSIDTEHYAPASIDATALGAGVVTTAKLADDGVTTAKLGADAVTAAKIADNAVGTEHIADAELSTLAGMQSGTASVLADSTALAATTAEINSICENRAAETTITDDDAKIPTSGAVVDYVAAQIAPLGGLEVIANEDSFPTTQPQSGVVISIADAGGIVVNGSGVSTTARTSGNGSDNVTINGFPSTLHSTTLTDNMGLLVSSTGSGNTYTYHKLLGKESDIKSLSDDINDFNNRYRVAASAPSSSLHDGDLWFDTTNDIMKVYDLTNTTWRQLTPTSTNQGHINTVSGIQANVTTVAGISSNVTTVAGISSNVTTVAGISSNVTSVAGNSSNINSAVSNASNINAAVSNASNINSAVSNASNINTVAGAISNINTTASNISGVNSFAERYRIASSAPSSSLDVGDLYFDTTANELKVYKSSGWAAAGSTVNGTSARYTYNISGTPSSVTGADANGNTLAYDAGFADVYLNGVRLSGADITITSGDTVTFASALADGDVVDVVGYGTFNVAAISASSITSGTINIARLGSSGTKDSTTFLRGDNTFATVDTTNASNLSAGTLPNARLSSVPNSALANSSITINGSAISLGGSVTVETDFTWETKTSAFNAAASKGYFVDTSSSAITATLPASPTAGDTIRFIDLSATFDTNNLTVARNGKKLQGDTSDMTVATERAGFALVFSGDTQGWLLMEK